jgi:tetratricopeptide (TPR) repeat protein
VRADGRELLFAAAVLGVAVALAFGPALSGEILSWDDGRFVDDDPAVRRPGLGGALRVFTTTHAEAYHPLHRLVNAADRALFGRDPTAFHATSLALWTAALVAVVALFRRLGTGPWAALAGALVVGVHPLQAEAVAWISGKKDVLAMLLFASAAATALGAEKVRSRRMLGALGLHALGLLSKTSVVVLPVFLLLADVLLRGRSLRAAARRAAPFALLSLAAGLPVLAIWSEAHMIRPAPETGLPGRVAWIGQAIFHHGGKTLWPDRLSSLYPIDPAPALDARALAGLALYGGLLASPWLPRLGRARLGTAFVGVALLPVSNVVPLAFFVADRYASLALLGVGWLVALAVDELSARGGSPHSTGGRAWRTAWPVAAGIVGLVAALGWTSRARAAQFTSDERLVRAAVRAQPGSYFAHVKLGEVLRDAGDLAGSLHAYRAAIRLEPDRPLAHGGIFLAVARLEARRRDLDTRLADRALPRYMHALDDPDALWALAASLREHGLADTALVPLERAIPLSRPTDAQLRAEAAHAMQRGDRKAAILLLRHVRRPDAAVREALRALEAPARP